MRIAITNAVLSNTGDAAIFQAVAEALEREIPGVHIVGFDSDAHASRVLYPNWSLHQQVTQLTKRTGRWRVVGSALQLAWSAAICALAASPLTLRALFKALSHLPGARAKALRAMSSCDVVVSSGGTYLVDHYHFLHRIAEIRLASALGKPVVLWTQSVGPFRTRRSRRHIRLLRGRIAGVFLRDRASVLAWCSMFGESIPYAEAPDAVFALDTSRALRRHDDPAPTPASHGSRPELVLSVRYWDRGVRSATFDSTKYQAMMRAAASAGVALGWTSTAISTCQGLPTYAYDDSQVAAGIFSGMGVGIDRAFRSPTDLLRRIMQAQGVVATRMHMAILALLLERPVIAVAYEAKTVELFESLGFGHNVVVIEEASSSWMTDKVRELAVAPESFKLDPSQLDLLRDRAMEPARFVATGLNSQLSSLA